MKRIQYYQYGGPDKMRLEEFMPDTPSAGQVLVRVKYAAINPIDWKLRNGLMKIVTGMSFPRAMGMDFSGVVMEVGGGVARFVPGDEIFGMARLKESGAFGEVVITNEAYITHKPKSVSFEDAACLATPGVMAWMGLVEKKSLRPGQHIFVNGCAGAVGEATVQIALMLGLRVSGSCSEADVERMRRIGLENVYDYRKLDLASLSNRFDLVYDAAATIPAKLGISLLRKSGVFLDLDPKPIKFLRSIFSRNYKVVICRANAKNLDHVATAAESGRLKLTIGKTVPLNKASTLISEIESGVKFGGKGVISME